MWECLLRQTFHVHELAIHEQVNLLIGPDDVKLDDKMRIPAFCQTVSLRFSHRKVVGVLIGGIGQCL